MKITFLTPALVAILGVALAGAPVTVKAQATATAPAPAAAAPSTAVKTHKKSDKTAYEGTITAIDASSVTVTTTKAPLALAITPATKFQFGTKKKNTPATAADFAVGDKVTGSYSTDATGAMTASTIRKKKSTATPAAAAAPAAPAPAPAPAPAAN